MDQLTFIFIIFFVTLGPIKTIPAFFILTNKIDKKLSQQLALRSTIVATVIAFFVGLILRGTLQAWRISFPALEIAGGILLLISAISVIMKATMLNAMAEKVDAVVLTQADISEKKWWCSKPVLSPLAIPVIITPIGIVAILLTIEHAGSDITYLTQILITLVFIMLLDFLGMWYANPIMRWAGLLSFQVLGWIFAILQAGLGVEAILKAFMMLHVIPS